MDNPLLESIVQDCVRKLQQKYGYCGLAYAVASLPIAIVNGAWVLLALHTFICLTVSITLGVNNPNSARSEETLIGFIIGLLPMFMIGG